jgi:hypothetical protein
MRGLRGIEAGPSIRYSLEWHTVRLRACHPQRPKIKSRSSKPRLDSEMQSQRAAARRVWDGGIVAAMLTCRGHDVFEFPPSLRETLKWAVFSGSGASFFGNFGHVVACGAFQ